LIALTAALATVVLAFAGLVAKGALSGIGNAPQAAVAVAAPQFTLPANWKLKFSASFTGTKVNTKVWATCYWWVMPGQGCTNFGDNGGELEWYTPAQATVKNGALHLVAKRENTAGLTAKGKPKTYTCRSGMVTTAPSFNFKYGLVQIEAQIPYGLGLWPALWLAPSNHQWPPEIDILEHWNSDVDAKVYLHPKTGKRQGGPIYTPGNLSKGWHSFRLYWTKTQVTWYIDGISVFSTKTGSPAQAMYLVMDVADITGGTGTCTGTMAVKSVKVWQP
jgi:beta-glucanase (GH16 family)